MAKSGADYVLAVKENQPLLYEAIDDSFETARAAHFQAVPAHFEEHFDAGHGRYEVRRDWLVNDLSALPDPHTWPGWRGIGIVKSEYHEDARVSRECRYYIMALDGEVKAFANAMSAVSVEPMHRPTSTPSVNSPFDSSRFYSPADTAAD